MAGRGGFEPPLADPESAVLPLDDLPIAFNSIIKLFSCQLSTYYIQNLNYFIL